MIAELFERKTVYQDDEPVEVQKMLDDLRKKGIQVIPVSQNKYRFNHDGTDCIIDTKDYTKKKKVTYHIRGLFKWYKLVFGILLVVKIIWLIKFLGSQAIAPVPEDREARAEYDRKRNTGLSGAVGSIMSMYGSL